MARSKFEDGDVFEIFLSKRQFAYCRVIGRNEYSPLFELFKEVRSSPQSLEELRVIKLKRDRVLFINQYSLKARAKARFLGNVPLSEKSRKHPPIFRQILEGIWHLDTEEGRRALPPGTRYEDLLKRRYVDMTIFATEGIVAYLLKGKQLVFPPSLGK